MPTIFTSIFASLDGVVDADSDWQFPFFDEELFEWVSGAWGRAAAVLLGRSSFEGYERLRNEHPDSPVISFLDATPTFVVSDVLEVPLRPGAEVIRRADAPGRIAALRDSADGDILVLGSAGLMRHLTDLRLIDEVNVMLLPVIVGAGPRLLAGDHEIRCTLALLRSRPLSSGAVELTYTVQ